MERAFFTFEIRPGTEAEYKRRHDEIWPEMVTMLKESGVSNYSIFLRGTQVFLYLECEPDRDTCFERIGATDVNARWSESFENIIVDMTDEHGELKWGEEVWHLD